MSNRSSYSCPLSFTDVRIPKENLVGELNRGFPIFMKCVDDGRVAISAVAVGMAQGVLELSLIHISFTSMRTAPSSVMNTGQGRLLKSTARSCR